MKVSSDTFNYLGESLFSVYKTFWKNLHDVDLNLNDYRDALGMGFNKFSTFPFAKVVKMFDDETRALASKYLGITYLPYSEKQLEVINRSMTAYPYTEKARDEIKTLTTLLKSLETKIATAIHQAQRDYLFADKTFISEVEEASMKVYDIPTTYFWMIVSLVEKTYTSMKLCKDAENMVNAVLQYVSDYRKNTLSNLDDFEQQLVADITTLMIYSYPHPEMVLAVERLKKVLELYYAPTEYSKLFMQDIETKMKRYIVESRRLLGKELMDVFEFPEPKAASEEDTRRVLVERWLHYLTYIRSMVDNPSKVTETKQYLYEETTYFRSLPYRVTEDLKDFDKTIKLADSLVVFE